MGRGKFVSALRKKKNGRPRNSRFRKLGLEQLEDRRLLAGVLRYPLDTNSLLTNYYDHGAGTAERDWSGAIGAAAMTYDGHRGTDFAVAKGSPVYAAAAGEVVSIGDGHIDDCDDADGSQQTAACKDANGGAGNFVKIEHSDGFTTHYFHLQNGSLLVSPGDMVECGDQIAQVASSGNSTGYHLHFETRMNNVAFDPFAGPGSPTPESFWIDQGTYGGLPSADCPAAANVMDLTDGDILLGLSGAAGSETMYKIDVPANQDELLVRITGGTGDADMYIRHGQPSTQSDWDYRPWLSGNEEVEQIPNPDEGEWYIMVVGFDDYDGLGILADYSGEVVVPENRFEIGDTVETTVVLNVRTSPDLQAPEISDPDYGTAAPIGMPGVVLAGPVDADGFDWWQIDYGPGTFTGWSAGEFLIKTGGSGGGGDPTNGDLAPGTPATNIEGGTDAEQFFTIDVPPNARSLTVSISGGEGDADLYVRHGEQPTEDDFDYRPYKAGNEETVIVPDPEEGTWHIMIRGYFTFEGLTLEADYTADAPVELDDDMPVEGLSGADDSQLFFTFDVRAGQPAITVRTTGGTGDVDLYVRLGERPTLDEWDDRGWTSGNDEVVTIEDPQAGTWHVMLHGYDDFTNTTVEADFEFCTDTVYLEDLPGGTIRGNIACDLSSLDDRLLPDVDVSLERITVDGTPAIEQSKQTWLVIHGRQDDSDSLVEMARAIDGYKEGDQVMLLDWREGSHDNHVGLTDFFGDSIGLTGVVWAPHVASWVVQRLEALDIAAEELFLVGHSWGSYVAYEIAEQLGEDDARIVALDPANNAPWNKEFYDHTEINFGDVTEYSWAFYGNNLFGLNFASFGSATLAGTADEAFILEYEVGIEINPVGALLRRHAAPRFVFESLVRENAGPQPRYFADFFDLRHLENPPATPRFESNSIGGVFEGEFVIRDVNDNNKFGDANIIPVDDPGNPTVGNQEEIPHFTAVPMSPDTAGNAMDSARPLGELNMSLTVNEFVGASDPNDYYSFTLGVETHVEISLDSLGQDADLTLHEISGSIIDQSTHGGTTSELVEATLDPGTYYIRVYPYGNAITFYGLNLTETAPGAIQVLPNVTDWLQTWTTIVEDGANIGVAYAVGELTSVDFDTARWHTLAMRAHAAERIGKFGNRANLLFEFVDIVTDFYDVLQSDNEEEYATTFNELVRSRMVWAAGIAAGAKSGVLIGTLFPGVGFVGGAVGGLFIGLGVSYGAGEAYDEWFAEPVKDFARAHYLAHR